MGALLGRALCKLFCLSYTESSTCLYVHQVAGVAVVLVFIDKSVTTAVDTAIDTVDVIIEGDIVDEDICSVG